MKKEFEAPEIEVVEFATEDIMEDGESVTEGGTIDPGVNETPGIGGF